MYISFRENSNAKKVCILKCYWLYKAKTCQYHIIIIIISRWKVYNSIYNSNVSVYLYLICIKEKNHSLDQTALFCALKSNYIFNCCIVKDIRSSVFSKKYTIDCFIVAIFGEFWYRAEEWIKKLQYAITFIINQGLIFIIINRLKLSI